MTRARERRVVVVAALAASLIAGGCRPGRLRPALPTVLPQPERLLQVLSERRHAVASLRGFAQIAYESGEENIGSRHAVLARQPDRFRLEVLSPFGALAVVACDGRELIVYARRESKIYRGPATAGSVAAYTAVPVSVRDVVAILLGLPPERTPRGPASVARDEQSSSIRLSVPLGAEHEEVWFAPGTLLPLATETPMPDGRTLRVEFSDYRDIGGLAFPHRIEMRAEPGDRVVRVRYTSPSLNTEVADGLFAFPARPGIEELVIEQYPVGGAS